MGNGWVFPNINSTANLKNLDTFEIIWIWSSQILGKAFASAFDTLVETSKSYVENSGSSQARVQKHDAAGGPFSRTLGE